jgi:hypothetical protein
MLKDLLKLSWMAFWRMWLFAAFMNVANLSVILFLSFATAFTLRIIFKHDLDTFPMWKLFNRQNPLTDLRRRKRGPRSTAPLTAADTAYAPGAITGYEPQSIASVKISDTYLMHGTPGVGLSSSGFGAEAIALGQRGEENFAKTLSVATHKSGRPIIESTDTFWSVGMPSKTVASRRDPLFESDIDCVVVSADTIYLLDLKYYTGGNVAYRTIEDQLHCVDLKTGHPANNPKKMSRNMEMAQARFTALFPKMNVKSRVVFMPTERGIPRVTGVYWPGNIPAVGLMSMLNELSHVDPASANKNATAARNQIARLLKN